MFKFDDEPSCVVVFNKLFDKIEYTLPLFDGISIVYIACVQRNRL